MQGRRCRLEPARLAKGNQFGRRLRRCNPHGDQPPHYQQGRNRAGRYHFCQLRCRSRRPYLRCHGTSGQGRCYHRPRREDTRRRIGSHRGNEIRTWIHQPILHHRCQDPNLHLGRSSHSVGREEGQQFATTRPNLGIRHQEPGLLVDHRRRRRERGLGNPCRQQTPSGHQGVRREGARFRRQPQGHDARFGPLDRRNRHFGRNGHEIGRSHTRAIGTVQEDRGRQEQHRCFGRIR
mmetsp:Transcript_2613/g.5870  ORF Transcript_2613/g.5870 Transcript_2613/m.5870 type:complete len:235 (+) Transcript_2613:398-1102(+)